jgi:shikimate kinase
VVALGGGAPLQDAVWAAVQASGLSVFLDAPLPVLSARIGDAAGRPLAGRPEAELEALLAARRPRYLEADHVVDADRPVPAVAEEVLRLWCA